MSAEAAPRAQVDFRDVKDPSAFVHATINKWQRPTAGRGPIIVSPGEREELHAEGMAILCKLARDFRPHLDGYEHEGWFSGYAAMFLPRKLGDAWHRMHDNHQLVTDRETGKRRWEYREKTVSLEAMTAEDPDRHGVLVDSRQAELELRSRVRAALDERWARKRLVLLAVCDQLGAGASRSEAAVALGLTEAQVQETAQLVMSDTMRSLIAQTDETRSVSDRVSVALDGWWTVQRSVILDVADLLGEGANWSDVAVRLELNAEQVYDAITEIQLVADRLRSEER